MFENCTYRSKWENCMIVSVIIVCFLCFLRFASDYDCYYFSWFDFILGFFHSICFAYEEFFLRLFESFGLDNLLIFIPIFSAHTHTHTNYVVIRLLFLTENEMSSDFIANIAFWSLIYLLWFSLRGCWFETFYVLFRVINIRHIGVEMKFPLEILSQLIGLCIYFSYNFSQQIQLNLCCWLCTHRKIQFARDDCVMLEPLYSDKWQMEVSKKRKKKHRNNKRVYVCACVKMFPCFCYCLA